MKHISFLKSKNHSQKKRRHIAAILAILLISVCLQTDMADAYDIPAFIVLSCYQKTLSIGQSFTLIGFTGNGENITWKSGNTRTASVNTYGEVTAKKAGTCKITARIKGAEASCKVTVKKTEIALSSNAISMENGTCVKLSATTSNGSAVSWKSSKKSVAYIDEAGRIEAQKPGNTTITASADGTKKTCKVTVKKPTVTLNATQVSLYRRGTFSLKANVSSGRTPAFSSRKESVASIDEKGLITAHKHGTALINVKIDGVTRICEVTVKSPEISFSPASVTMKKGKKYALRYTVSSGIRPVFKSSRVSVASVNECGTVTAYKKGSCLIYATEDGTKACCRITVQ